MLQPGAGAALEPLPVTWAHHWRQGRSHPPCCAGEAQLGTEPRMDPRELGCSGIVPQQRGPAHVPWLGSISTMRRDLHGDSSQTKQGIEPKLGAVSKGVRVLGTVLGCSSPISSPEQVNPPLAATVEETGAGGVANIGKTRAATPGSLGRLVSWAYPTYPGSALPVL